VSDHSRMVYHSMIVPLSLSLTTYSEDTPQRGALHREAAKKPEQQHEQERAAEYKRMFWSLCSLRFTSYPSFQSKNVTYFTQYDNNTILSLDRTYFRSCL
jgi:hypothetical protein